MVEQKISLDFTKNGIQKTVYAKQGENGARDIIISLAGNGEPLDVSGYTLKMLFEDDTYLLLETENPVRFTVPQALCITTGDKICEIQITKDSIVEYAPQFRVTVEATLGAEAGQQTPIGEPIFYEPLLSTAEDYSGTFDGDEKVPIVDPDVEGTRLVPIGDIIPETGGREIFSASATYDGETESWSSATLTGGKTIQDIADAFNDGKEVYLLIDSNLFSLSGLKKHFANNTYVSFSHDDSEHRWAFCGYAKILGEDNSTLNFYDESPDTPTAMFVASTTFSNGKPSNATLVEQTFDDILYAISRDKNICLYVYDENDTNKVVLFSFRGGGIINQSECVAFGYDDNTNHWLYIAGGSETGLVFYEVTIDYDDLTNKPTIPTAGTITSGSTGYATGGDVYSVVGNVESALSSINTALEDLIGGE